MPSSFAITEEQFLEIEAAYDSSVENYAAMYELIYQATLGASGITAPDGSTVNAAGNVQAWFGAAAQANLGEGAASVLIRTYTQAYKLHNIVYTT